LLSPVIISNIVEQEEDSIEMLRLINIIIIFLPIVVDLCALTFKMICKYRELKCNSSLNYTSFAYCWL
jgi:hypothetical protein